METIVNGFSALNLSEELMNAIVEMGYEEPSSIQAEAIPLLLEGHDMIGQAQTGSGKTAAFGIPAIEKIDVRNHDVQCIVLCPTRELAVQVNNVFKSLSKYKKGLRTTAIYGGESIERQIKALREGVHVVIGTPGRVIDHIDRGTLQLEGIHTVILDEADEMLNMGFIDDIRTILSNTPDERQTVLFSATMPKEILELTRKFQNNPKHVKIAKKEVTVSSIEQKYYDVRNDLKKELLVRLLDFYNLKLVLVFCNTKRMVDELVEDLQHKGFAAEGLHGDLRQAQRNQVMGKFRQGILSVLVATDVAARGIDVENVEAVFNYDLPLDVENYVHRIGRTGRAGKSGMSFSFVSRNDRRLLQEIERYTKAPIAHCEAPSASEVVESKKKRFFEHLKTIIETKNFTKHLDFVREFSVKENIDMDVVAAALLRKELDLTVREMPVSDERKNERPDRREARSRSGERERERGSERRGERGERGERRERGSRGNFDDSNLVRVFMNVGKKDKIGPGDIVGAITGETGINGSQIGSIDIFDKYTFVDLPKNEVHDIIEKMGSRKIKGVKVNMELAK